jgi:hypothetical protein
MSWGGCAGRRWAVVVSSETWSARRRVESCKPGPCAAHQFHDEVRPAGTNHVQIQASQNGQPIAVSIQYDKAIWSGLSWAVGEVKSGDLKPGVPVVARCSSLEASPVQLQVRVKAVQYASP